MNILVVTGIFPPDIGGPATYVPAISSELVKRGHKITVVTLSDALNHDDGSYSFRVRRIGRGLFKPWRFLLTVVAILRAGRFAQVLYVNGLYLEAVVANFFLRKPMVQKIVGDWAWERATNKGWIKENFEAFQKNRYCLKVQILKVLRAFCTQHASMIIIPSQYLARWMSEWKVSKEKLVVIYNATDPVNGIQPAQLPLIKGLKLKVATVGRLIPLKQIDRLIEAIADCNGAGLVIVGEGPERNRLQQIVRMQGLTDRIYFAGQRSKQEALSLMAACDLFVLNSTHEGFPHVVLEAMSLGLPVLATAVGGTPEMVQQGKSGLLVAPGANEELSKSLLDLVSSPVERWRMGNEGKRIAEQFRLSDMVKATEAVLSNPRHHRNRVSNEP